MGKLKYVDVAEVPALLNAFVFVFVVIGYVEVLRNKHRKLRMRIEPKTLATWYIISCLPGKLEY